MLKLDLDSKKKRLSAELMLEGEAEPLYITVERYELFEENDVHYLRIQEVSTSRIWLNTLAEQYLEGRRFEIPSKYAHLLRIVM